MLFLGRRSSIDPVATLSILSSVGVSQGDTLYTLIFGESLLNDGVSIVLFDSLVRHMGDAAVVDQATIHDTLYHFAVVSAGSMVIGVLCGGVCTLYFWALQGKHTAVSEVALFFTWALVPYYVSETVDCQLLHTVGLTTAARLKIRPCFVANRLPMVLVSRVL